MDASDAVPSLLRRNQYNVYGDAKSLFLRVSAARKIPTHIGTSRITYHAQNKFRQSLASGLLRERERGLLQRYICMVDASSRSHGVSNLC